MSSPTVAIWNEREVDGSWCSIPGLPEPREKPLFNVENLTLSGEGRLFVTGSLAVYEIVKDKTYRYQEIPITAHDVPRNCLMNGITARGNSLYLACTHIHQGEHSLLPNLLGDARKIDQNSGVLLLMLAEAVYRVDSYLVRADLGQGSPAFTEGIRLPGKCFANGLDGDGKGNLYAANSVVGGSPNLLAVRFPQGCGTTTLGNVWHRPLERGTPNGVKFKADSTGDYVYMPIRLTQEDTMGGARRQGYTTTRRGCLSQPDRHIRLLHLPARTAGMGLHLAKGQNHVRRAYRRGRNCVQEPVFDF